MAMYRQGDVLVMALATAMPHDVQAQARTTRRIVLAHGEATGHAHAIDADGATLYDAKDGKVYLQVTGIPVALLHEEHRTIQLPPGVYEVRRQREYHPDELRTVVD